jgi:hypothetical protein
VLQRILPAYGSVVMLTENGENKRHGIRQPVLKSAKAHFHQSVVDCLVLDFSATGVRLSTELPVAFPDEIEIELRTGSIWRAAKRWQRGVESGFELLEFVGLNFECSVRASAMLAELRGSAALAVTQRMAQEGYFESPALREASVALASAHVRLEEALQHAIRGH